MAANRSPAEGGARFAEDHRSLRPVQDPHTNASVRWLYVGSGILFLATIGLGVWNVFTERPLPRGQMLAHFHSGTIGWLTLSVIATALWLFTGDRTPSRTMAMAARLIALVGLVAVAGYILAFFIAFNRQTFFWMLPLFGVPAALVIWAALGYTLANFKSQAVVTTTHLLLVGALFVASVGAAMGVLWGLTYSTGISPYPSSADPIGTHAAPMDMYLALAFAGIVEFLIRGHAGTRWSKAGLTQALLGVGSAMLAIVSLYFGIEALVPLGLLGFLLAFFIYFGRVGWRTFAVNPFGGGRAPAVFWGGLWFPVYIVLFVVLVFVYFVPGEDIPHALGVAFVHATFVGMATNLLLAIQSSYAGPSKIGAKLEPTGVWILNLGLIAFFAGEFIGEDRRGALLMALGALIALMAVWSKYSKAPSTTGT